MDPDAIDCQTAMYCNHYPSWERKAYREGTLRRIAHTDFEVLTLLFQRPGTQKLYTCIRVTSVHAIFWPEGQHFVHQCAPHIDCLIQSVTLSVTYLPTAQHVL